MIVLPRVGPIQAFIVAGIVRRVEMGREEIIERPSDSGH
jgi:hypothetical protein